MHVHKYFCAGGKSWEVLGPQSAEGMFIMASIMCRFTPALYQQMQSVVRSVFLWYCPFLICHVVFRLWCIGSFDICAMPTKNCWRYTCLLFSQHPQIERRPSALFVGFLHAPMWVNLG